MSPREPEWWLALALATATLALGAFIWVWWVHGAASRRGLTRELAVYWVLLGLARAWWDLASGLVLVALGIGLWHLVPRLPGRHLDDRAVMGKGAAGRADGADDDDDDD
jgi:hypothetical protein